MSTKILVVYASKWGSTKKMAEQVVEGAKSVPDTEVSLKEAEEATLEDVQQADALIVGSPVHMGSPNWKVKKFIDAVCSKLWMEDKMNGKVGAVFVSGAGYGGGGGGVELTMLALLNNLAELGLILVPLPKNTKGFAAAGLQWGPYGRSMGFNMEQTGLDDAKTISSFEHGKNVARVAKLLKGQKVFGD